MQKYWVTRQTMVSIRYPHGVYENDFLLKGEAIYKAEDVARVVNIAKELADSCPAPGP